MDSAVIAMVVDFLAIQPGTVPNGLEDVDNVEDGEGSKEAVVDVDPSMDEDVEETDSTAVRLSQDGTRRPADL